METYVTKLEFNIINITFRRFYLRINSNVFIWLITGVFLGVSIYFTLEVNHFKNKLNRSSKNLSFSSGVQVEVAKVIDGDEISVSYGKKQFVVRILGIKSFNPNVNDPKIQNIAYASLQFLNKELAKQKIELKFKKFMQDSRNRVLAYVEKNGKDIGLQMVQKGLSLVFTRYPFSRMTSYLSVEKVAIRNKTGLWGITAVAKRSKDLKKVWAKELEKEQK